MVCIFVIEPGIKHDMNRLLTFAPLCKQAAMNSNEHGR